MPRGIQEEMMQSLVTGKGSVSVLNMKPAKDPSCEVLGVRHRETAGQQRGWVLWAGGEAQEDSGKAERVGPVGDL